ncbi:MAG: pyridoxal-phosphate dependent enzyme [Pseudomonadota bacterium]
MKVDIENQGSPSRVTLPDGALPSVLHTIGATPIVRLPKISPPGVDVFAKLEAFNPMGSIKDRIALAMIEAAERSGALQPGQTVIEATSGNTGIGLAMVCAQKGYPLVIVMAESFSLERRRLLRFLGAKVILTSAAERGTGMFRAAEYLAEKNGWFFCRQFENQANADVHFDATGQEILDVFGDGGLDIFVTGFGTGGSLNGIARALRLGSPQTKIVVAEPENSQILASDIPQVRKPDGSATRSHPNARAHPVQGWSPDFIPKLAGDAMGAQLVNAFEPVTGTDAIEVSRRLATEEGIFCGISGGATVASALALASTAPLGTRILAMVPDTGERYLSTPLFDHVDTAMSETEQRIAASVPKRKSAKAGSKRPVVISHKARAFVLETVKDPSEQVVMFGFEWCEFCWSVRRLFQDAGIPFKSIDVDGREYRESDQGGEILRALFDHTGLRTVPQVFVGGALIGGATDVLKEAQRGDLQSRLLALDCPITPRKTKNPMLYLPAWAAQPSVDVETIR